MEGGEKGMNVPSFCGLSLKNSVGCEVGDLNLKIAVPQLCTA